jgi:hypothetical protein
MSPPSSRPRAELTELLRSSLGDRVAEELIVRVATELHLETERFTKDQALQVLERVAQEPGLPGVAGRFAKTRVILLWSGATTR